MAAADNRATWEQLLRQQGATGPTGPQGPAGPTGAAGPSGLVWTEAATVVGPAAIVAVPGTLYPCDVTAGNVVLEVPDASTNGGAEIRFAIVAGAGDVSVDASGTPGQNVQIGGSVNSTIAFNAGAYAFVSLQAVGANLTWYVIAYT